jgi:hypothetical protein
MAEVSGQSSCWADARARARVGKIICNAKAAKAQGLGQLTLGLDMMGLNG